MKYFNLFCFSVTAMIMGCTTGGGGSYSIKGNVENSKSGMQIYLEKINNNEFERLDSAFIDKNGNFEIKTTTPATDYYRLSVGPETYLFLILDSLDNPVVNFDFNDPIAYTVSGSKNSEKNKEFYNNTSKMEQNFMALRTELQANASNPEELAKSRAKIGAMQKEFETYVSNFVKENINEPVAITGLTKLNPMANLDLFKQVYKNQEQRMAHSSSLVYVKQQIDKFAAQQAQREQQLAAQEALKKRFAPGTLAPDINLNDPQGNPVALSSLRGNVVLLDFWASWCKPCRMENPNVVRMYDKYKNKGFAIYSVSLDKNKDAWEKAIKDDNLQWTHVSDLQFWNSAAAKLYGVQSIPFTVLLDKEGKIIGINYRGAALEAELEKVFG